VNEYINHRIKVASDETVNPGSLKPVFDAETVKAIFAYSGGIPRRINTLCDLVLLSGFAKKAAAIDAKFVQAVIKEFNLS
jgi:general secretion pathway protein A